uniref:Vacuolar protein sorting-associated protein 28 homolog n=1 Tax=Noctiluca scintillans TaxID=2966 RepID=A0A7S0ZUP6_NOCSC|mmetsp:Transcript_19673/g.52511  ORF Transcript_19673/g.52511 Transcript_19673/m.52511 type:complete len:341 (+) Transcript_19673:66-1088(+)
MACAVRPRAAPRTAPAPAERPEQTVEMTANADAIRGSGEEEPSVCAEATTIHSADLAEELFVEPDTAPSLASPEVTRVPVESSVEEPSAEPDTATASPSVDPSVTPMIEMQAVAPPLQEQVRSEHIVHPTDSVSAGLRRKQTVRFTAQERQSVGMLAELYSILVTTEHLESAFIKGVAPNDEYERASLQLIAQFKTLQSGLKDKYPDVRAFAKEHGLKCPLALERLITGMPATVLVRSDTGKESLACFRASEAFITLCDALKLGLTAVDELLPLVRDLQMAIAEIPGLPDLAGVDKVSKWLVTVNAMSAMDVLDEAQCRQLSMDVEQAYTSLKHYLQEKI